MGYPAEEFYIGKKVELIDRRRGRIEGVITGFRDCEPVPALGGVITGCGFPQVKVKVEKPEPSEGWVPLNYVRIVETHKKEKSRWL